MDREVAVLGAGIVGICSALSLAEQGRKVMLIDRDEPGRGASFGNAGVISPWSVVPQSMPGLWKQVPRWLFDPLGPLAVRPAYLPRLAGWGLRFLAEGRESRVREISAALRWINRDCVSLYRKHLTGTGCEGLLRDSCYVHAFRDERKADLASLEYRLRQDAGAEMERIGAADLRDLEPALTKDFQAAILIKGQARAMSPGGIGSALTEKFRKMGGEVLRAKIRGIRPEANGGWACDTDQGQLRAGKVVLAMGAWSSQILHPLGIRVPMQAERGYHVSFPEAPEPLNNSVMDMDMKVVASSMEDGLRVAGTAEFAGLDAPMSLRRANSIAALARRLVPALAGEVAPTIWSGQRPSTPDSLPCIGAVKGLPGLFSAFGHGHFGLMMAPATGQIIAGLVAGKSFDLQISAFDPGRFG